MGAKPIFAVTLLALLGPVVSAHADDILLKDGTKISGTIVGYENDSFRVETPYGFAVIRKDKVADIKVAPPKKEADTKPKADGATSPAPATAPAAATPNVLPAVVKEGSSPVSSGPTAKTSSPAQVSAPATPTVASTKNELPGPDTKVASAAAPPAQPAPTTTPAPVPAPDPSVIRDEIHGNEYVNLTYGFQMYKPPSWDLLPAARRALPDAVAALGTNDQTTLFVIGREHAKDSLDAHAAATGKELAEAYENYRLLSSRHVTVAGLPAVEQRSRGTAEGHDWSVLLLTILKGNDAYTLLGMTWAESDLIQVQENVLSKAANSLTFVNQ